MSNTKNDFPWRNENRLRKLYAEEGLSSREVANEFGCDKKTVLRWLDKFDIEKTTPTWERPPNYQTGWDGYTRSKASHKGKQYTFLIHRLAAVAKYGFSEVAESLVHHKSGIPWDNRVENLELVESQSKHMTHHYGDHESKLSKEDVRDIRQRRESGESGPSIASDYSIDRNTVYSIAKRDTWEWLD